METDAVAAIAFITGYVMGWATRKKRTVPALDAVSDTRAIDRANYLQTLRRELANILIWRNPQRYLDLYRQTHQEVMSLNSWRTEEVSKRLAELCTKYPSYNDFDIVSTREYVLYADSFSLGDDVDLEGRYRDLILFAALSVLADETWKHAAARRFVHTTNDKELIHLEQYIQRIKDSKLKYRIEQAIHDNDLARKDAGNNLSNGMYEILKLPHFAENRYGVHLKRTNEYGIYSLYVFDDGRSSESYYRSNATFELEQPLDPLHTVLDEIKLT